MIETIIAQRIKEELKIAESFQNGPKPLCCKCGRKVSSCTIIHWGQVERVCPGCRDILLGETYNRGPGFMKYDSITGKLTIHTQAGDIKYFLRNNQVIRGA